MRAGVMDKLGLGYEDLKKVKPDIIMISCSGFGAKGRTDILQAMRQFLHPSEDWRI